MARRPSQLVRARSHGETIHVYAIAGPPVYSDGDSDRIDFDIELPLWGVTWVLKGYVIKSTLEIDAAFSVKVPIIGSFQLAQVKGNLQDGVKVTFGVSILHGDARFIIPLVGFMWTCRQRYSGKFTDRLRSS
ncbi:hypothetical protein B0F90DRAFT_834382 [Multifurca ochricompacta]|uniref:Uncharacterized protein n=1 Tax=Multifurca ochricompacta TaxID=376703 RepID=A0AAD4M3G5_9AGAM|nr:hypothetical protein B0F90DRAFT_834382 [Multifurca ochricompacta]